MSTERERCPVCDFPLAAQPDLATLQNHDHDTDACAGPKCRFDEEHFGQKLCWNLFWGGHVGHAIDWRARALEAEATVKRRAEDIHAMVEGRMRDNFDARARMAAHVETLLSTPLASPDFLEGVRRALMLIRNGPTTTEADEVKRG